MKPIHKFNNGNGATLCHKCNCIISIGFADDLYCKECIKEPKQEILTYTEAAKKEERIFNSTMMSKQETLEEAGIIAAGMCEHLDAREQAFFIAGFIESAKWQQEQDKKCFHPLPYRLAKSDVNYECTLCGKFI
jgi:hypothetical protein